MQPDTTRAYSEAIKGVEAIAIPAALPKDKTATLGIAQSSEGHRGTVDGFHRRPGRPAGFTTAVIAMIDLLWSGQRDRHAGPEMKVVSPESARRAVHTAATLVQWFTNGHVHKKSDLWASWSGGRVRRRHRAGRRSRIVLRTRSRLDRRAPH
ncbi:hypothetical protein ETD83_08540 [Actinomadura soli]|uniref:Uncharacterized protein n=1 Tax=Actinomadura soli TaxID=2508997 RepID=A0A5C4JH26_9ACTN|nr:hypothetical protein [Actinomadura soli]TMR04305.1 hypothetical protein ETD83_08540 [Actinomadura soli]